MHNYNQQYQMPFYHQNQHTTIPNRNNGEVYKSSIYENKSNSLLTPQINGSQSIIEKSSLNQSGGNNKVHNYNHPKRMPRSS